jgi:Amt family ammonium transporter
MTVERNRLIRGDARGGAADPQLGGAGFFDWVTMEVAPYDMLAQVIIQAKSVGITLVWSGLVSLVLFKLIDLVIGLRVSEETERQGLDTVEHGERAYG